MHTQINMHIHTEEAKWEYRQVSCPELNPRWKFESVLLWDLLAGGQISCLGCLFTQEEQGWEEMCFLGASRKRTHRG